MAYDMNAEGINGVQQSTSIVINVGGGGWIIPPPIADGGVGVPNGFAVLFVTGDQTGGGTAPVDLVAVQAVGGNAGPGVIGLGKVGVAGFSNSAGFIGGSTDWAGFVSQTSGMNAGVFGQSEDQAPGVLGQGGGASNPISLPPSGSGIPDPTSTPAGTGVVGIGGAPAAATTAKSEPPGPIVTQDFPPVPAGPGVVGAAGGAMIPMDGSINSAGVVGIGAPPQPVPSSDLMIAGPGVVGLAGGAPFPPFYTPNYTNAGVVGVGSGYGGFFGSTGNRAQLSLFVSSETLPETGVVGDLYIGWYETQIPGTTEHVLKPAMFLCVRDGGPGIDPTQKPQWAPFVLGSVPQDGGAKVTAPPTYP
jgi:hypothetical protein